MTSLGVFGTSLFTAGLFIATMALYVQGLPRRPRFAARAALALGAYLAATVLATYVGYEGAPALMAQWSLASQIAAFTLLAGAWLAIVLLCFDVTPLNAMFVVIAGYSTQNLADSLAGVVQIVRSEITSQWPTGIFVDGEPLVITIWDNGFAVSVVAAVVVCTACQLVFARRIKGQ